MFKFAERIKNVEAKIMENQKRLELLESYAHECSSLHVKAAEHWAKQDDALKELTHSNMRLANSLDLLNKTVSDILNTDRPQADFVRGWRVTMTNGKLILVSVAAIVAFSLSILQLVKPLL